MHDGRRLAKVYHADLRGDRAGKYRYLSEASVSETHWNELVPDAPHFMFRARDTRLLPEYRSGCPVPEIFGPNGAPAPGIVTTHDQFAVSWTAEEAAEKVDRFLSTSTEDEARRLFRLCTQSQWQYRRAKEELATGTWHTKVVPILYRPFDMRWTVFDRNVAVHRRERVMKHMLAGENLGFGTIRSLDIDSGWMHAFVARGLIQHHTVSLKEVNFLFPLYLYSTPSASSTTAQYELGTPPTASSVRRPNLAVQFIADFSTRLRMEFVSDGTGDREKTFGPEDIFHYMYAVFHSPAYRERYAEFLKVDFPRLPLTTDAGLFRELCTLGAELTGLHLMETHSPLITRYPVAGDNTVEKPRYTEPGQGAPEGRVWINRTQYFEGVAPELWEHRVGGYQVAEKWLKDRRGRALTYDDLTHYQRTLAALHRTMELMEEVDEAIERHGGWPLAGSVR